MLVSGWFGYGVCTRMMRCGWDSAMKVIERTGQIISHVRFRDVNNVCTGHGEVFSLVVRASLLLAWAIVFVVSAVM